MARINMDDNVESQDEFWKLLDIVKDRDAALGKLVRFFRIAQKAFGHGKVITEAKITDAGLKCMIESGWAKPADGGFTVTAAEKHFDWYRQKVEAGGKRAEGERDNRGRFTAKHPADSSGAPPESIDPPAEHQPLAPAPVPVLAPVQKKEIYTPTREIISGCIQEWAKTLEKFKIQKDPWLDEIEIGRLIIQFKSAEKVSLALLGAGYEEKTSDYDPGKHVSIRRLQKPQIFDKFVNLGAQARAEQAAKRERQAIVQKTHAGIAEHSPMDDLPKQSADEVGMFQKRFQKQIGGVA